MRLDDLKVLAEDVRADRESVSKYGGWANPDFVARWSVALSPSRVLAMIRVIQAAKEMRIEHAGYIRDYTEQRNDELKSLRYAFDAVLSALEDA